MSDRDTGTKLSPNGTEPSVPSTDLQNAETPAESRVEQKSSQQSGKVGSKPMLQQKWDQMYARLLVFKGKHDHLLVPNRYSEDRSLGAWVSTQRRQYKSFQAGEETPMNTERASKLESIGFVWSTRDPRHVPWEVRYKQLLAYQAVNGDTLVPISYKPNPQLSNWVSTQRQEMKLLRDGRPTRLTAERIHLLNNVHFVWEAQRGGPKKRNNYDGWSSFPLGEASVSTSPASHPAVSSQAEKADAASLPLSATKPGQAASPTSTDGKITKDSANSASESKSDHSEAHPIKSDETLAKEAQASSKDKHSASNELEERERRNEVSACVTAQKNSLEKGDTSGENAQVANTKDKPNQSSMEISTAATQEFMTEASASAVSLAAIKEEGKREAATEIGPCTKKSKKDGQGDKKEEAAAALLAVGKDDM
eukprot:CAMPEP_0113580570 /NCGR_PEP_ID=MMETSP0015_2-20120614/30763_1 /TAXON_ID=2838 /ORGANISM="Odontella" /LENGTH=422 /DNA_ID=CAMNT_0000484807 /DNA_START=250 /DNA_END=1518 /DNA_ORIENTATION=- /assembly_acc=CAM_ASM_000160